MSKDNDTRILDLICGERAKGIGAEIQADLLAFPEAWAKHQRMREAERLLALALIVLDAVGEPMLSGKIRKFLSPTDTKEAGNAD